MKTMTMKMKYLGMSAMTVLLGALLGVACGDDTGGDGSCNPEKQGFTECNVVLTCQPGQYCDISCTNGCLSDVNCACNQVCEKQEGSMVGMCTLAPEGTTMGTPMTGGTTEDPMTSGTPTTGMPPLPDICKDDCDGIEIFGCFDPGELQACYDRCPDVTEAQIKQFENCIADSIGDCTELIGCLDNLPEA